MKQPLKPWNPTPSNSTSATCHEPSGSRPGTQPWLLASGSASTSSSCWKTPNWSRRHKCPPRMRAIPEVLQLATRRLLLLQPWTFTSELRPSTPPSSTWTLSTARQTTATCPTSNVLVTRNAGRVVRRSAWAAYVRSTWLRNSTLTTPSQITRRRGPVDERREGCREATSRSTGCVSNHLGRAESTTLCPRVGRALPCTYGSWESVHRR